ncbi:MAG: glucoamylase family protein [Acholeplasmataceae bacterium]
MNQTDLKMIKEIQDRGFLFFMNYSNFDLNSKGYGLTPDHTNKLEVASIAATGFALSSYVIGVESLLITKKDAIDKIKRTLETLLYEVDHYRGFFAHFVDIKTGKRHRKCEYSTIDTALCMNGILTVERYFKDEEITKLSNQIIDRVDWDFLIYEKDGTKMLHMAYNPDIDGDYANGRAGFIHHWDMYAEQLMMYLMIASKIKNDAVSNALYEGFTREKGSYQGHHYIYSPGNTLFIYQFPLCWLDLENIYDKHGISWHENARSATLGHRAFCMRNKHKYQTFSSVSFGLSASDSPKGYRVFHALPAKNKRAETDGTISPHAMIGSLFLTPKESLLGIKAMHQIKGLYQKYGFMDAYNLEAGTWISNRYIAIDKGLEMLAANAYLTNSVRNAYMSHELIIKGMEVLGWQTIGSKKV